MLNKSFAVITSKKIRSFKKVIQVDSDKSISIRSFLIGAISHNISQIKNVLESEDVYSTIKCLKKLGVKIRRVKKKEYLIYGKGLGSLYAKNNTELDFGNSGTLARLIIGILSTTPDINLKINGDKSLVKRDMSKLIFLMNKFGAEFLPKNKFKLPLKIISSEMPVGIYYKSGISAQLKSAVILAALNSFGTTRIYEDAKSRDHTENILIKNKKVFKVEKGNKNTLIINGKNYLNSLKLTIPGDPSSAAFITALTLLNKNSSVRIKKVGLNPRRTGFYQLLKKSGAKISFKNIKKQDEITGDILVKSGKIKSIKASAKYYPITTDEYPILFVLAALSPGISIFKGITDLANKESNRIQEMKKILKKLGIRCITNKNEMKIYGKAKVKKNNKIIKVNPRGDHRIAMSSLILSLITGIPFVIKNFNTVYTSSPSFLKIIKSLGGSFEIKK